jgi:quercetin dioxygenase-like cupin family protein
MKIEDLEVRRMLPGTEARLVHSDRMTLAFWHFDPGTDLPEHAHPHDQITTVLEGQFELTIDGTSEILTSGHYRVIPPEAVHSGHAITACRIIDVFSPVREDFK